MLKKLFLIFIFTIVSLNLLAADVSDKAIEFDHLSTGFPLDGLHEFVECGACHIRGVFKGTPKTCAACHDAQGLFSSSSKALGHIPTSAQCDECHTEKSWNVVVQIHSARAIGRCTDCHNGELASSKPATHVQTALQCDSCHGMEDWGIRRLDHSLVFGACESCHNGGVATAKPSSHITTTNNCDLCHISSTWAASVVDHSAVIGVCSHCHNGVVATGQGAGHFVTARECSLCHMTITWDVNNYFHSNLDYPDHGTIFSCASCHINNAESPAWKNSTYAPDCAACHESQYNPAFHLKAQDPITLYSVEELKNCAGACHVYTDNTLTTIAISRSGEHSFGGF